MRRTISAYTILLLLLILLGGCESNPNKDEKPLAKVFDKYLYPSDVANIFSDNMSSADSLQLLKSYVDRWIKKQLMLNRAEKNLTESQKNVSQQLEDYRSSLLIFKYEQEYIHQKLDTTVSTTEMEAYYRENASNFTLSENIVKALFIKIRKDDPYYDRIKSLYRSDKEEDIKTLDNLAYQVAIKYDYFNDQWVPLSQILKELPQPIESIEELIRRNRSIEVEDDVFSYLVSIRDLMLKGEAAPFRYEKANIKSIILNKRKQKLIMDIEAKIYLDARNYNHFTVFIE
jgi:hypothetical protein